MSTFWQRTKPLRIRLALLLAVLGPGIITANVDNDAGGITTYSMAGARYGYGLLWMLPLVVLALIIVQEMSARLGVITGKGLADLMRESLGVRTTAIVIVMLLFVNLANTVSEFAGVAASMNIFGLSKYITVPLAAGAVWLLIVKGSYKSVEKVFLIASAIYLCYVISGFMGRPNWGEIGTAFITPRFHFDAEYVTIFVTVIGTTIAPWMQFYQQSSIVDKGIKPSEYGYEKLDVIVGSLFAVFVAAFIVISCAATIWVSHSTGQPGALGLKIDDAAQAAQALMPLASGFAGYLFALGLLNASLFSAAILPLSTAYTICEAFGWESGVSRRWKEAPIFFGTYTAFIIIGAVVVLLPIKNLVQTMMVSQTLNGVLLPIILLTMLKLINDKRLMGKFKNGLFLNIITWIVVVLLIILAVVLMVATFFPQVFQLLRLA
jgi:NRAMP (natural resistance-associated macrophage protein)-like metal ion transporter